MKGVLDLISDNDWVVRYTTENGFGLIKNKTIPLSRFNKIMYKNKLEVDTEIEFDIISQNDFKSNCKCSKEQNDDCEFYLKSGINECINFEMVEVKVAKIVSITPKKNQTFDREIVKQILIEVKNRFAVMSNDNYTSDLSVIEWFERNYPKK